jgi:hypothetical protein
MINYKLCPILFHKCPNRSDPFQTWTKYIFIYILSHTVSIKRPTWTKNHIRLSEIHNSRYHRLNTHSFAQNGFICALLSPPRCFSCGALLEWMCKRQCLCYSEFWAAVGRHMHVATDPQRQALPMSSRETSASGIAQITFALTVIWSYYASSKSPMKCNGKPFIASSCAHCLPFLYPFHATILFSILNSNN